MDLEKALNTRRSIRKYTDKKISKALVEKLIDAARQAPSSHNLQPWNFIVINGKTKEKIIKLLKKASVNKKEMLLMRMILNPAIEIIQNAPLVILVFSSNKLTEKFSAFTKHFGKSSGEWKKIDEVVNKANIQSISCAVQNMMLKAHSMGLGGVWLGITMTQQTAIKKYFKTKNDFQGIVTLGFPAENPKKQKRRKTSEILSYYD